MPSTGIVKYHVKLKFEVDGLVEKADIIGAIFGQTEGLLGPEMNLNELQKVSKVGRIEVNVDTKGNMAKGDALIPMSTDISTAALIAAAIESIDKVGPFQAKFNLVGIDDIRAIKKKVIVDRAKKIVQDWATRTISEGEEMLKDVYDASKPGKLTSFGKAQLACGTGVFDSDWIILVEGRADVINLLRAGFDNAIAIEGARIDETVTKLTEGKRVVAFLDGDRAGDLILKELHGLVKIDKVLRAPPGREVEECTPIEIAEILKDALVPEAPQQQQPQPAHAHHDRDRDRRHSRRDREREPRDEYRAPPPSQQHEPVAVPAQPSKEVIAEDSPEILTAIRDVYPQINETLEAVVLDGSMNKLLKVPVSEVIKRLDSAEGGKLLVIDGIVTQRLVDAADKAGIEYVVGHRTTDLKKPGDIRIRTFGDIGISN
ncbi:DNA primase DnaG [Candidatus Nitrososphaera gargensis]|uniref:DNA primase DnaG n=1 Tax=Candidatus Nitrososphaera gargensis TaxID=497727 RepID=UPI0011E56D54|nr:DNA primase DnaG [Candidatus Nitrososphaera gargensis]